MIACPPTMFRYKVSYARNEPGSRVYHRVVIARDTDEARAKAKIADPFFAATTRSPRRLAEIREAGRVR